MDRIIQTNTQLLTKSFYELCPNCGNETKISIKNLKCKHCGTVIKPCSLCNNDGCDECKVITSPENRIAIFHRNADKSIIYIEEFAKGGNNQ